MLLLTTRATRYLTRFFLKCSKDTHSVCRPPAAADLCLEPASSSVAASQYLACLAKGNSPLLYIAFHLAGNRDMIDFKRKQPLKAKTLRASIYLVAASIYRRQLKLARQYPFRLMVLFDERAGIQFRKKVASEYVKLPKCCLGDLAYTLREVHQVKDVDAVFGKDFQTSLRSLVFAFGFIMSVADIERIHRRSKALLTTNLMNFDTFSSKHCLEDLRRQAVATAKNVEELGTAAGTHAPKGEKTQGAGSDMAREQTQPTKKTGFEVWKAGYVAMAKVQKRNAKELLFTKEGRAELTREWAKLTAREKCEYEMEAMFPPAASKPRPSRSDRAIQDGERKTDGGYVAAMDGEGVYKVEGHGHECYKMNLCKTCKRCSQKDPLSHATIPPPVRGSGVLQAKPASRGGALQLDGGTGLRPEENAKETPLHPERYRIIRKSLKLSKSGAMEKFRADATSIPGGEDEVPAFVKYLRYCDGVCVESLGDFTNFTERLYDKLAEIVKPTCKMMEVEVEALPL